MSSTLDLGVDLMSPDMGGARPDDERPAVGEDRATSLMAERGQADVEPGRGRAEARGLERRRAER